jgi:hypothetical protein
MDTPKKYIILFAFVLLLLPVKDTSVFSISLHVSYTQRFHVLNLRLYITLSLHTSYQTVELCWSASPDERPDFAHLVHVFESLVAEGCPQTHSSNPYYINLANNGHSHCNGDKLPLQ